MLSTISISLSMGAKLSTVWSVLTEPAMMRQWMGEDEMQIEIETTWKVNTPIVVRGVHHQPFVNDGIVLEYSREQRLTYNSRSSLSQLPAFSSSYSVIDFTLTPVADATQLTLTVSNFPTETIQQHLAFYWRGTMQKIKRVAEGEEF